MAVIAISAVLVLIRRRKANSSKKKSTNHKNNLFTKLLSDDEKKVLNSISGVRYTPQSAVISATGFSKVKVSKILSKLVKYRLVKLKSNGRQNLLRRS